MSFEMKEYSVKVSDIFEENTVQDLFLEIGYSKGVFYDFSYPRYVITFELGGDDVWVTTCSDNILGEEITLDQLKGMVLLHNNDINDATHVTLYNDIKYLNLNNDWYYFSNYSRWAKSIIRDSELSRQLIPINKQEQSVKEYLTKNSSGGYTLVNFRFSEDDIEVPEGAEVCAYYQNLEEFHFWKDNGSTYYANDWLDCEKYNRRTVANFMEHWKKASKIVWVRNETQGYCTEDIQPRGSTDTNNIDWKLSYIKKWMEGDKIQYILGEEKENTQWHNFTDKSIQFIKRSDIKLRVAPKYVTVNGVEFKSKEKLMKYIDKNFDMLT